MALDVTQETQIRAQVREIARQHASREGPLLPILNDVQALFGAVTEPAIREIADVLNLTAAEVHGVVSFYPDYRTECAGRTMVRLCRAEACKAMGADALAAEVQAELGLDWGETAKDGSVTLRAVYCLGLCASGPAAQVGDTLVGRATARRVLAAASEDGR